MVCNGVGAAEQCVDSPEREDIEAEEETMVTAAEPKGCVCVVYRGTETVPQVPAGGHVFGVACNPRSVGGGTFICVCVTSPTGVRVVSFVDNGSKDGNVADSCADVTG